MAKKKSPYGQREFTGEAKERGFLGEVRLPNGRDVMTEVSIGKPGTSETYRPALTRGIHSADLNYIRETGKVPEDVYATSQRSAEKRIAEGKSPFWNEAQDSPLKDNLKSNMRLSDESKDKTEAVKADEERRRKLMKREGK